MMIPGPCGDIEAEYAERGSECIAVLCHPHPRYGGSMHDAVLSALEGTLLAVGVSVLRFNFRGVGASAGAHDDGRGEVEDVLAACRWAREQAASLILGGYSFGAAAAVRAAADSGAGHLLLVAPPPALLGGVGAPELPGVMIAGDSDSFVDADELRAWAGGSPLELTVVSGADHFFMAHTAALDAAGRRVVEMKDSEGKGG